MRHRISIDLGKELGLELRQYCEKSKRVPSDVVRAALARYLSVPKPQLIGHHANLKQYQQRAKRP